MQVGYWHIPLDWHMPTALYEHHLGVLRPPQIDESYDVFSFGMLFASILQPDLTQFRGYSRALDELVRDKMIEALWGAQRELTKVLRVSVAHAMQKLSPELAGILSPKIIQLLDKMTKLNVLARPSIQAVAAELMQIMECLSHGLRPPAAPQHIQAEVQEEEGESPVVKVKRKHSRNRGKGGSGRKRRRSGQRFLSNPREPDAKRRKVTLQQAHQPHP